MRLKFNSTQISLLNQVKAELPPDKDIFLVGGAVRDALLGMENHDLDFALPENPTHLAKKIAKRLNSPFFILDDARHTARILYKSTSGNEFPLDFVQFTGNSLLEDLQNRDFTFNAMAVSLSDLGTLIDPLNGRSDLEQRTIRACDPRSLLNDPIRVLRGVRLAHQFGLNYADGMPEMMRAAAKYLPDTSSERQRDEFFRILEGPEPHEAIRDCQQFNVIESIFPDLAAQQDVPASAPHIHPLFEHTLHSLKYFWQIIELLKIDRNEMELNNGWFSTLISKLSPFSTELKNYFSDEVTPGRRKFGLAMFGALLHDIGKPKTMKMGDDGRLHFYGHDKLGAELAWEAARQIQLSNAESEWVSKFVNYHMGLLQWGQSDVSPTRRGIYRFFNKAGDVGIAIGLFSLADRLATYGESLPTEKWERNLSIVEILFTSWWEHKDQVVSPKPLLDGNDIQKQFGLQPGKKIGQLLEALVEAQASGEVTTRAEAQDYIREQLN